MVVNVLVTMFCTLQCDQMKKLSRIHYEISAMTEITMTGESQRRQEDKQLSDTLTHYKIICPSPTNIYACACVSVEVMREMNLCVWI